MGVPRKALEPSQTADGFCTRLLCWSGAKDGPTMQRAQNTFDGIWRYALASRDARQDYLSCRMSLACLLPVCVTAQESAELVVFSIKLGLALSDNSAAVSDQRHQVAILLVSSNTLLHQAAASRDGNALFRCAIERGDTLLCI